MYFVYILQSLKTARYYIGHTNDVQKRLLRHNKGRVLSTKSACPWALVLAETHTTRAAAMKRELEIKGYKSGLLFKRLVDR